MNWKSTAFSWALVFSLSFLVAACGSESLDTSSYQLNGTSYTTIDGAALQHQSSSVSGNGSVVIISPLSGIPSNNSYSLEFTLAESGSLTLVTNSNQQLKNGLNITFSRNDKTLTGVTQVGNSISTLFTLADIDASGKIQLQIDVHNNESPAHILIWTGSDFEEAATVYNSEDPGLATAGNGAGTLWGFILSNATVTSATVGTPKFTEGS